MLKENTARMFQWTCFSSETSDFIYNYKLVFIQWKVNMQTCPQNEAVFIPYNILTTVYTQCLCSDLGVVTQKDENLLSKRFKVLSIIIKWAFFNANLWNKQIIDDVSHLQSQLSSCRTVNNDKEHKRKSSPGHPVAKQEPWNNGRCLQTQNRFPTDSRWVQWLCPTMTEN